MGRHFHSARRRRISGYTAQLAPFSLRTNDPAGVTGDAASARSMNFKRALVVLAVSLFSVACADLREKVTLEFQKNDYLTITTYSPLKDTWEARFARIEPSSERITIEKAHGEIASYEHSATVPVDDLPKFLSDVDLTVRYTEGDGYNELEIYPGTSSRATRAEREELDHRIHYAARRFVDYVKAMRHLYDYLDANPQRAESVFSQLFIDPEKVVAVSEEENALMLDARMAMAGVLQTAPAEDALDRFMDLADRVNDPFPAVITVRVPYSYTAIEGFKRIDDVTVRAEVTSPGEALAALQGKWVSPDPLSAVLSQKDLDPIEAAHQPRHAELSLTPDEVANAFIAQLKPKARYRIRWTVLTEPSS